MVIREFPASFDRSHFAETSLRYGCCGRLTRPQGITVPEVLDGRPARDPVKNFRQSACGQGPRPYCDLDGDSIGATGWLLLCFWRIVSPSTARRFACRGRRIRRLAAAFASLGHFLLPRSRLLSQTRPSIDRRPDACIWVQHRQTQGRPLQDCRTHRQRLQAGKPASQPPPAGTRSTVSRVPVASA